MNDVKRSETIIRQACPSWARLEGLTFAEWKVIKPIGRGGTAEVYLAENIKNNQRGALKLLLPEYQSNDDIKKLFLREADFLDDFSHDGIPQIHLQTSVLDRIALVMDYIPGDNLMTMVHNQVKLPTLQVFIAAVKIIAYLHEQNVVHNDIKLANFILSPKGRLHLVDFGSARRLSLSSTFFRRFKASGPIQGTASYLAPELIQGKAPSKGSDIWALGILAHYLYTGSAPISEDDSQKTMTAILNRSPPGLRSRCPEVDQSLGNIVDRCLVRDPALRHDSAADFLQLLRRYRDGTGVHRRKRG